MRRPRAALSPVPVALALLVVSGLLLRLTNNDYGLPYVYSADEGSHFTNRAVAMFGGDANPGYFQNPSAFTYLVWLALWLRNSGLWPLGRYDVPKQFSVDPTSIWVTGRSVAALLGMLGVVGTFVAGSRMFGARVGLAAATVLTFAFLPVAYSRVAVTDVGTFLPVAASLMWSSLAIHTGRRRELALSGAAAGLAVGFKYTAGLVLLPLVLAAALQVRRRPAALIDLGLALLAAAAAFILTTPYLLLDFETARRQILAQAQTAGTYGKIGQGSDIGLLYYGDSLTWGLGWVAAALAVAGFLLLYTRDRARAAMLAVFPVALFVYLSIQSRYFGRWLLPAYPALALLAGYGAGRLSEIARLPGRPRPGPVGATIALVAVMFVANAQPLAADLRTADLLGREDTRMVARDYLTRMLPASARVVIEPAVPSRYYRLMRRGSSQVDPSRKEFVRGFIKANRESRMDYAATLSPATVDLYRRTGFCHVVTLSLLRGRAEKDGTVEALAYYRRLERESKLLLAIEPYWPAAEPVPFSFDLSYNYYPAAFLRPGPEVRIYRLSRCRQGFGALPPEAADRAGATG